MPNRTLKYFVRIFRTVWTVIVALARFMASLVGLLAESIEVPASNDATNHAVRGGVLNYRTGKLDDGTDPYGWYERD